MALRRGRNLVLNRVARKEFLVQSQAKAGAGTGKTPVPPVCRRPGLEPGKMKSRFPARNRQSETSPDRDLKAWRGLVGPAPPRHFETDPAPADRR